MISNSLPLLNYPFKFNIFPQDQIFVHPGKVSPEMNVCFRVVVCKVCDFYN